MLIALVCAPAAQHNIAHRTMRDAACRASAFKRKSNMGKITAILQAAQQRAKEINLPYEGALYPGEAYEILQSAPGAKLVDVRTRAELDWVGRVRGAVEIENRKSGG